MGEREASRHDTRGGGGGGGGGLVGCNRSRAEPEFLLRWGSRKRLRCAKIQVKASAAAERTIDRQGGRQGVVRAVDNGSSLLLRRVASPHRRILRNSEASGAMKVQQQQHLNGSGPRVTSPEGERDCKTAGNGVIAASSDGAAQGRKKAGNGGGRSSSGSSEGAAAAGVWPNFAIAIALTAREKEEDFMAFKGTKLPQRPKKRSKFIQRTLNLVSPGSWLCDLTQDRYEVREKKVSKKRPRRGLKAMGSMESDSE